MYAPVYARDDRAGHLAVFVFFGVLSFYASNPLVYLGGVGVCYYLYSIVIVCIKAIQGETLIVQFDALLTECPYRPLQVAYILYGAILGSIVTMTPVDEFVAKQRVVSTDVFIFLAVAYFLWGLARLVHNHKYYRREFEKNK